jgi:hypothetical protein
MTKRMLMVLFLGIVVVTPALAAPNMLDKGFKSLSFEADSAPTIVFGWNVTEMTKFNIGGGIANTTPPVIEGSPDPDSETNWQFQTGINRYMGAISNDILAPYMGAQVNIWDNGSTQDTSFGVRGHFGVEAFVVESLSIGGNIGINYNKDGDAEFDDDDDPLTPAITVSGGNEFTTTSSSILATLYW